MPNSRIFICTWNCENQTPGDTDPKKTYSVEDFQTVTGVMNSYSPLDIIVFAMQEVGNGPRFAQTLSQAFPNFHQVVATGLEGMTKPPKKCYTFIVVMVRDQTKVTDSDSQLARSFGRSAKMLGARKKPTKGGAVARMVYDGLNMSFTSSHLDAGSTSKRLTHVAGITNAMKHGGGDPDLGFFMGDLNYRLRSLPFAARIQDIVKMLLDDVGRRKLYQLDSFKSSDFPNWSFPDPEYANGNLIMPTYKRVYKPHGYENPCLKMLRLWAGRGANNPLTRLNCALCYSLIKTKQKRKGRSDRVRSNTELQTDLAQGNIALSKKGKVSAGKLSFLKPGGVLANSVPTDLSEQAAQLYFPDDGFLLTTGAQTEAYELGWLDRIGYKNPGATVTVRAYRDLPEVVLSDHTPLFMVADAAW